MEGDRPIRVLVADDHDLVRRGLIEMLSTDECVEVLWEATSCAEVVHLAGKENPDVVLLDVELPGVNAEEVVGQVTEVSPSSKIVALTLYDDIRRMRRLLTTGISGYMLKSATREELIGAIRSTASGEDRVVLSVSRTALSQLQRLEKGGGLSDRELEILLHVARGASNREIALTLHLSEGTVKRHIANIYVKLKVSSRAEATRKALCEGWITPRDITHPDKYR